ncbi:MAG: hypothetical protein Q7S73_01750 [bacterium]|nr:hypothetical protein [bacterium]
MINTLFNTLSDVLLGCLVLVKIALALVALYFVGKSSLFIGAVAVTFVVAFGMGFTLIRTIMKAKRNVVTLSIGSENNSDLEKLVNGRRVSGRLIASAIGMEHSRNQGDVQKMLNALPNFGIRYTRTNNPKLYILTWA